MAKTNTAMLMSSRISRRTVLGTAAGGLALSATHGRISGVNAQDKPTVAVGSKAFTEQEIMGNMLALLLEDAGYEVERKLQLASTLIVHEALVSGDVDTYVEYTGTGLITILGLELPQATPGAATPGTAAGATPAAGIMAGVDAVYNIVKTEYESQFGVIWLDPLGFNNTYTLAVRPETATELGLRTISDLKPHAGDLIFGATQEFLTRPDGLPGLTAAYSLEFEDAVGMDEGIVYEALDSGDVDVISAFATDGRIPALGLVLLEDDLGFFPPYFAAPVVRQDLLDQDPAIRDVLNKMAGRIDNARMADLNFQVDDGGEDAEDVARTFLEGEGLIGA